MKKIGIAQLREHIRCRVANPKEYKNKTLVLWDCTDDDILSRVTEEACIDYNLQHPDEEGAWFSVTDMNFMADKITEMKAHCKREDMYGFKHKGILLFTGRCSAGNKGNLCAFVNDRVNRTGRMSEDWALVACVHSKLGLTPEMFGDNCEIYKLEPDLYEWGAYIMDHYDERVCRAVVAYVKQKGMQIETFKWHQVLKALGRAMKCNKIANLYDMPEATFNDAVKLLGGTKFDEFKSVMDDFYNFVADPAHRKLLNDPILSFASSLTTIVDMLNEGCPWKGIMVIDDKNNNARAFTDSTLKQFGPHKQVVLNIDESWNVLFDAADKETDLTEAQNKIWDRLVRAAFGTRNGFLVLNITNMRIFGYCWMLKQLVKQEHPLVLRGDTSGTFDLIGLKEHAKNMKRAGHSEEEIDALVSSELAEAHKKGLVPNDFKGAVIFIVSDMTMDDVLCYVDEHNNRGEFDALCEYISGPH